MNTVKKLLFVCVLGIVGAFCGVSVASADGTHDGHQTTAEQAASAGDMDTMENFVLHAKQHLDDATMRGGNYLSVLRRQMREDEIWKHEDVYLIVIGKQLGEVKNHGIHTKALLGDRLGGLPTVEGLLEKLEEDAQGGPVCEQYGEPSKWSCAVEYDSTEVGGVPSKNIIIGGFHHGVDDPDIVRLECPDYEPSVTAKDVYESQSEDSLQDFVKGAITRIRELSQQGEGSPELVRDARARIKCFGKEGTWKHRSIYLFVMNANSRVVINGNNPELTGSLFQGVTDEDGVDIGKEIIETAGADGKGGFVRYKWDDPDIEGDEVNEPNKSPGTSPKISYVEGATFSGLPGVFIFGSGIYPKADSSDDTGSGDGDGCAIAGTSSKPGNAFFNLFLIVFSLCLAVSLRNRLKM